MGLRAGDEEDEGEVEVMVAWMLEFRSGDAGSRVRLPRVEGRSISMS